jgi:parallel beta-helix repeat protein
VIVRNNRLYNNNYIRQWGGAIVVGRGSNCLVYNNLIYSNNGGIDLQRNAKNEQIYNNTIYNNKSGISIPFDTAIGTIIKNNIIYQNSTTISDNGAGTIQSNNLMTDPKFVNALTNDFILQATSPAIDAGITLSIVATDLNGIARPQGVRYDIGAHEYPTSQPAPPPAPKNLKTISVTP